jgi:CheY-like chemotaxis protein
MHILYIDDDAEDREFFNDVIQGIDPLFVCRTAADGEQGLKELQEFIILPDFIFLDVNMPVMNGKEFLAEIKQIPRLRSIPVIMYSTTSDAAEGLKYLELGAYQVLKKPNSVAKARELITSIIRGKAIAP